MSDHRAMPDRTRSCPHVSSVYDRAMPIKRWSDEVQGFVDVNDDDVRPEVTALLRAYRDANIDTERAAIRAQAERLLAGDAGHASH